MEWVAAAIICVIGVVIAFAAGRKNGRSSVQGELNALTSENARLTQENRTLSEQVALYAPKKKHLNSSIKDAIGSISVPSFGMGKASPAKSKPAGSSSGSAKRKGSSRSSDDDGFFGAFLSGAIISGGDYSGGGSSSDSGGSSGGSCE